MSKSQKSTKAQETSEKSKLAVSKRKSASISTPKSSLVVAPVTTSDIWQAFDDSFARFRDDFEDLLFPATWPTVFSVIPETRVPTIDLEEREKDFLLKAEMPGFKKEDIEIEAQDDSITISGNVGWKYDKKEQAYLCKERACKSFYRTVDLPEEIVVNDVSANLSDGVLEIVLPKMMPKPKRKVSVK
jgi:HSP20 family protein